jgi:LAO/AO transport system kinase
MTGESNTYGELIEGILSGDQRALASVISKIEDRAPGYRELVSNLHEHTGNADVIGLTGAPGSGKSTLVDKMAEKYREKGETVGVIAIDPSSPFTGGAVLGDRIRMASNVGDMGVFFRSMSARGSLGGLSTATTDAIRALDAFGKDRIIVETVGAGQNEVDIVRAADTVAVLVPPGSGDAVQTLKAGILEIADVFVVNKADRDGADRTVKELREMVGEIPDSPAGHHGAGEKELFADESGEEASEEDGNWTPPVLETVAKTGEGVEEFMESIEEHSSWLDESGEAEKNARKRYAAEIRTLLRQDTADLLQEEIERGGGIEEHAEKVLNKETDPYSVVDEIMKPVEDCVNRKREEGREGN